MDIENDDALVGIGKTHRVMIWDGQQERERELHWGLPSRDPDIFQIPLLKSETAIIDRPCLVLANEFGFTRPQKKRWHWSKNILLRYLRSDEQTSLGRAGSLPPLRRRSYSREDVGTLGYCQRLRPG